MHFNATVRNTIVGVSSLIATSCTHVPNQLSKLHINNAKYSQAVDFVNENASKILKDTTYKAFETDTVILSDINKDYDTGTMSRVLAGGVKDLVQNVNPVTITKNNKITKYYNDIKAVVKKEFFKSKNGGVYVPVELYGKR